MKRYGLVRLLWRQFGSERGASVTIAGVVLLVAFAAAAAPRALELTTSAELASSVSTLPPTTSALSAELLSAPTLGPSASGSAFDGELDATWGALDDALLAVRDDIPEPARDLVGDQLFALSTSPVSASPDELPASAPTTRLVLLADPRFTDYIELTAGDWPIAPDPGIADFENTVEAPIEIVLSTATADRMQWPIGEARETGMGPLESQRYVLVGTFDALDADDDYWQHTPTTLEADYFDDGNARPTATGGAFIAPDGWATVADVIASSGRSGIIVHTRLWFPVDGSTISGANADTVLGQLRQVTSKATPVGDAPEGGQAPRVKFSTGIVDSLEAITARSSATTSVLLLATSGPLGVAIAVIALAGRLVADRRRPTLSLIAARGGSNAQLRGVLALEGLVLGAPAAIIGTLAAVLLVPGEVAPASFILPVLIGLAPAVILAIAASPGSLRQVRADLGGASTSRRRVIVELVGVVLAVASVALLLVRGIDAESTGVDPLLVATPLLLSLAACVLVLRVYPLPLAALERVLRPRRGVVAFVGTARSLRDPVAGLAPVLAMVVAVSVAVFSGAMFATLTGGVDDAVESTVGGDFRARGPVFTDDLLAAVEAVPGVSAAVQLQDAGTSSLTAGRATTPVTIILADADSLAALQLGLADAAPALPAPAASGAIPVVLSSGLAAQLDPDAELTINGTPVTVVATRARIAGSGVTGDWVYADRAAANAITTSDFSPRLLVASFDDDAQPATAIEAALGTAASTSTRAGVEVGIRSSAFVSNLQFALALLMGLVGLLCAVAVLLVSTINAANRTRLLAVLRTLGFSRRQSTTLVAWELAPVAVTAFIGGTVLGIALPLIVLAGIDLTPFTGGSAQPTLALDPVLMALVLGGFVAVVALASAVAAVTSRSANLAQSLRTGEE